MSNIYEVSFSLILNAGNANSKSIMAIEKARNFEFADAKELINSAEVDLRIAHQSQTDLIQDEAKGKKTDLSILLIHAQDHMTRAMISLDHAKEFVHIYELISKLIVKEEL